MEQNAQAAHYSFFCNDRCEFFPCHKGVARSQFNCLFCYCPLYALGNRCGGNFTYTEDGIKDCTNCIIPHQPGGYQYILDRFPQVAVLAKEKNAKQD